MFIIFKVGNISRTNSDSLKKYVIIIVPPIVSDVKSWVQGGITVYKSSRVDAYTLIVCWSVANHCGSCKLQYRMCQILLQQKALKNYNCFTNESSIKWKLMDDIVELIQRRMKMLLRAINHMHIKNTINLLLL